MVRQKMSITKHTALPRSPHKLKGKGGTSVQDQPTLQAVHQIKETGKKTHLQAAKTRETYARHDSKTYGNPGFKDAFKHKPNQGFQEHCSQSTIDGIQAAFKTWWDEVNGAVFCGNWHYICSVEVEDVVASIRHKISSDGTQWTYSGAMKKEYMDCILTWSQSLCLLNIPFKFLAFNAVAFTLWTRNLELVNLKHRDVQFDNTAIDGMFLKYIKQDTLMCYLLNKLYCYENNHSNALGPISWEADAKIHLRDHSGAHKGMLIWPASTEALHLAHASLTADVATLHASMNKMSAAQAMMSEDIRDLHQKFGNMTPMLHSNAAVLAPVLHSNITVLAPPPSLIGPQRTVYSSIPPNGMLILNVPNIICHWTEGEEWLSLTVLLKDWPHSWYNGLHEWKFNSKYYQFHENEKDFLKAYGSTTHLGYTSLLKAILAVCKEYPGNGECCCNKCDQTGD
ncbi:hypothetical protein V8B97DRAFT_2026403 [Scleroderma yunnanense]